MFDDDMLVSGVAVPVDEMRTLLSDRNTANVRLSHAGDALSEATELVSLLLPQSAGSLLADIGP